MRKCTISNLGTIVTGKTPSTKNENYWGNEIPLVTPKDIQSSKHIFNTERYLTTSGANSVKGCILPPKSICVSCIGNIGYTSMTIGRAVSNQQINSIIVNNEHDIDFVYYLMKSLWPYFKNYEGQSTTVSILNKSQFSKIEILIPDNVNIERKIGAILSSIDNKIELNQQQNNNLEQQAQVLIQEHTINLQTIVPLDEFCNIFTGRKNANEFDKNGVNKFFTCGPEALSINSYIYDGPAVIISGNGAYTGRTRFYNGRFDLYQRTYACTLKEKVNSNYIYLLYPLLKMVLEKKLMGGTHGSAIPYIVMNDIAKFEVPFDKEIFDKVSPACKAIIDKIQTNEQENEKLAEMRDALLPKLMSGEIDVSKVKINEILDNSLTDKLSFSVYLLYFQGNLNTPNWCYYQSGVSAIGIKSTLFQQNSPAGLGFTGFGLKSGL